MKPNPTHPGKLLSDKLSELGMNATELAKEIYVPPNRISQIIAGKRAITADTALRLAKKFGTSPHIWLKVQQMYELYQVRKKIDATLKKIAPR